jgi:hypothetical protein
MDKQNAESNSKYQTLAADNEKLLADFKANLDKLRKLEKSQKTKDAEHKKAVAG